ncbi:class III signal peptide-containing protein [Candidatus Micrarchaeota archaeon]|nr:class III signal peptide-containing protein [Candidatus Micrarchaeota archaeon]
MEKMKFMRDRKAQGAFEYILLLAGVLLIVVLAIIILRGSVLGSANNQITTGVETWKNNTAACASNEQLWSNGSGGYCCTAPPATGCYFLPL